MYSTKRTELRLEAATRHWRGIISYYVMAEHLAANQDFQEMLGLQSISTSQLSRKMKQLPTVELQKLFFSLLDQIKELTKDKRGITPGIGKFKLLDSTELTFPLFFRNGLIVRNQITVSTYTHR